MTITKEFGKTEVFIDGKSISSTARSLGYSIDFLKLMKFLKEKYNLIRANYYIILSRDEDFVPLRPLADFLDYNGFRVIKKYVSDSEKHIKGKNLNLNLEIAVNIMEKMEYVDNVVLFSGAGEFYPLVKALQRKGKKVTIISSVETESPVCSDDLRRVADEFIDLASLKNILQNSEDQ